MKCRLLKKLTISLLFRTKNLNRGTDKEYGWANYKSSWRELKRLWNGSGREGWHFYIIQLNTSKKRTFNQWYKYV